MAGDRGFDPKKYQEVKDRIPRFYKEYPNGRIVTNIIQGATLESKDFSQPLGFVVVKALLFLNAEEQAAGLPIATGMAQENVQFICPKCDGTGKNSFNENCKTCRGSGRPTGPNADCWVENAETSAIGRALANLGMLKPGDSRASAEEMRKAERRLPDDEPEENKVAPWVAGAVPLFGGDLCRRLHILLYDQDRCFEGIKVIEDLVSENFKDVTKDALMSEGPTLSKRMTNAQMAELRELAKARKIEAESVKPMTKQDAEALIASAKAA